MTKICGYIKTCLKWRGLSGNPISPPPRPWDRPGVLAPRGRTRRRWKTTPPSSTSTRSTLQHIKQRSSMTERKKMKVYPQSYHLSVSVIKPGDPHEIDGRTHYTYYTCPDSVWHVPLPSGQACIRDNFTNVYFHTCKRDISLQTHPVLTILVHYYRTVCRYSIQDL